MADRIEVDYQALNKIAKQFSKQARLIEQMHKRVSTETNSLAKDGWIGRGSDAYFREMQEIVLPGVQRLYEALEEANRVTIQINKDMEKAEDEASAPLRA